MRAVLFSVLAGLTAVAGVTTSIAAPQLSIADGRNLFTGTVLATKHRSTGTGMAALPLKLRLTFNQPVTVTCASLPAQSTAFTDLFTVTQLNSVTATVAQSNTGTITYTTWAGSSSTSCSGTSMVLRSITFNSISANKPDGTDKNVAYSINSKAATVSWLAAGDGNALLASNTVYVRSYYEEPGATEIGTSTFPSAYVSSAYNYVIPKTFLALCASTCANNQHSQLLGTAVEDRLVRVVSFRFEPSVGLRGLAGTVEDGASPATILGTATTVPTVAFSPCSAGEVRVTMTCMDGAGFVFTVVRCIAITAFPGGSAPVFQLRSLSSTTISKTASNLVETVTDASATLSGGSFPTALTLEVEISSPDFSGIPGMKTLSTAMTEGLTSSSTAFTNNYGPADQTLSSRTAAPAMPAQVFSRRQVVQWTMPNEPNFQAAVLTRLGQLQYSNQREVATTGNRYIVARIIDTSITPVSIYASTTFYIRVEASARAPEPTGAAAVTFTPTSSIVAGAVLLYPSLALVDPDDWFATGARVTIATTDSTGVYAACNPKKDVLQLRSAAYYSGTSAIQVFTGTWAASTCTLMLSPVRTLKRKPTMAELQDALRSVEYTNTDPLQPHSLTDCVTSPTLCKRQLRLTVTDAGGTARVLTSNAATTSLLTISPLAAVTQSRKVHAGMMYTSSMATYPAYFKSTDPNAWTRTVQITDATAYTDAGSSPYYTVYKFVMVKTSGTYSTLQIPMPDLFNYQRQADGSTTFAAGAISDPAGDTTMTVSAACAVSSTGLPCTGISVTAPTKASPTLIIAATGSPTSSIEYKVTLTFGSSRGVSLELYFDVRDAVCSIAQVTSAIPPSSACTPPCTVKDNSNAIGGYPDESLCPTAGSYAGLTAFSTTVPTSTFIYSRVASILSAASTATAPHPQTREAYTQAFRGQFTMSVSASRSLANEIRVYSGYTYRGAQVTPPDPNPSTYTVDTNGLPFYSVVAMAGITTPLPRVTNFCVRTGPAPSSSYRYKLWAAKLVNSAVAGVYAVLTDTNTYSYNDDATFVGTDPWDSTTTVVCARTTACNTVSPTILCLGTGATGGFATDPNILFVPVLVLKPTSPDTTTYYRRLVGGEGNSTARSEFSLEAFLQAEQEQMRKMARTLSSSANITVVLPDEEESHLQAARRRMLRG